MTKEEASGLRTAIERIESGRVDMGVKILRWMLANAGQQPPPVRLVEDGKKTK